MEVIEPANSSEVMFELLNSMAGRVMQITVSIGDDRDETIKMRVDSLSAPDDALDTMIASGTRIDDSGESEDKLRCRITINTLDVSKRALFAYK